MFIGMDPPKHDRLKALFQRGFTPKRIAEHEPAIREITVRVLDGVDGRETCDLVTDVAQPVVSRVIGSFMGIPPEDDEIWARLMNTTLGAGDPDLNPEGADAVMQRDVPEIFERCGRLIAERRERPTDDLTSVLVHAELDGERAGGARDRHGLLPARGGRQRQHEGDLLQRHAGADGAPRASAGWCSTTRRSIPGAVEESLRMFPAFAHFRRTATRDTELGGQAIREGDKVVMWYVSSNRDESRFEDPDRFDVTRNAEHQAFGAGGRHFCLGTALARLELQILFEETLARFPDMELGGRARLRRSRRSSTSSRRCRSGCARRCPDRGAQRRRRRAGEVASTVPAASRARAATHRDCAVTAILVSKPVRVAEATAVS